jgi:hypothetical protein
MDAPPPPGWYAEALMGDTLTAIVRVIAAEWSLLDVANLQYWRRDVAQLALVALAAAAALVLLARAVVIRKPGRTQVVLPAILRGSPPSSLAWTRHIPAVLFVAGLPFAVLAVADPYSSLVAENVTYPGRRISLMIDASDSMQTSFKASTLNTLNEVRPAFFTTVEAAKRFVELRRKGKYRDLMALVEFGSRAYVITPFTSDYDNLLLSMSLIGDPVEFSTFPESGTVIASALEESIEIFKAFQFLEASGNLMVIFTPSTTRSRCFSCAPITTRNLATASPTRNGVPPSRKPAGAITSRRTKRR